MGKLNIPKTLHVGYQERSGTYTGKLAYVIYEDHKGKKRKETSWQNWRNQKIEPDTFENVPTSGFVLNKGVGGTRESWGWNPRNEYIRVYDPRDFEFEISVANLLFILQHCTSTKGKGLEGEFVYSWDGTELVLLPVDCTEYQKSAEFTANLSKKVTKKDMVPGHIYLDKKGCSHMYLGRHTCRIGHRQFDEEMKPYHVFRSTNSDKISNEFSKYEFKKGFVHLAEVVDPNVSPDYADAYTEFTGSGHCVGLKEILLKEIPLENVVSEYYRGNACVAVKNGIARFVSVVNTRRWNYESYCEKFEEVAFDFENPRPRDFSNRNHWNSKDLAKDDMKDVKLYTPIFVLESGQEIDWYDNLKK